MMLSPATFAPRTEGLLTHCVRCGTGKFVGDACEFCRPDIFKEEIDAKTPKRVVPVREPDTIPITHDTYAPRVIPLAILKLPRRRGAYKRRTEEAPRVFIEERKPELDFTMEDICPDEGERRALTHYLTHTQLSITEIRHKMRINTFNTPNQVIKKAVKLLRM